MPLEESVPRVSQEEGPSPPGRAACGAPRGSGGRSSGVVGPEPLLCFLQERQGRAKSIVQG